MLTYQCKKCKFSFTQADKSWDRAIINGSCPECDEKLKDFHISEKDAEYLRKNLKETDLLNADKSLAEALPSHGWAYILCLLCVLFILFDAGKASDLGGTGGGKILAGAIFGLALLINFYWKRRKSRSTIIKNK